MKFADDNTSIAMSVRPLPSDDERMLAARRTVRLAVPAAGCRVFCLSGTIWLTEGTGGRDHILRRGESRTVSAKGKSVLWAVEDAVFRCTVPGPKDSVRVGSFSRRIKVLVDGFFGRQGNRVVHKAK